MDCESQYLGEYVCPIRNMSAERKRLYTRAFKERLSELEFNNLSWDVMREDFNVDEKYKEVVGHSPPKPKNKRSFGNGFDTGKRRRIF